MESQRARHAPARTPQNPAPPRLGALTRPRGDFIQRISNDCLTMPGGWPPCNAPDAPCYSVRNSYFSLPTQSGRSTVSHWIIMFIRAQEGCISLQIGEISLLAGKRQVRYRLRPPPRTPVRTKRSGDLAIGPPIDGLVRAFGLRNTAIGFGRPFRPCCLWDPQTRSWRGHRDRHQTARSTDEKHLALKGPFRR